MGRRLFLDNEVATNLAKEALIMSIVPRFVWAKAAARVICAYRTY